MLVKNVIGSSRFIKPSGYASWLDYWKAITGKIHIFALHQVVLKPIWLEHMFRKHIVPIKNGI